MSEAATAWPDDLRRIGQRLRQLRRARGLTCMDVQRGTGIAFNAVAAIERGEVNLWVRTLKILADFYEVPWSALESDAVVARRPSALKKARDRLVSSGRQLRVCVLRFLALSGRLRSSLA